MRNTRHTLSKARHTLCMRNTRHTLCKAQAYLMHEKHQAYLKQSPAYLTQEKHQAYLMQSPGSLWRTYDVVSALDNCAWNVSNFLYVVQNVCIAAQETAVHEVMAEI